MFKTARYVQGERTISKADTNGIWERWVWGHRLLHDPLAMSQNGGGLKHGVAGDLIAAAKRAGLKLHEREIQRRLQCSRAYKTESEIRHAMSDFGTWYDLIQAGFPAVLGTPGEQPFDWRTEDEKRHDRAQQLAALTSGQQSFSFFQDYEPSVATLADLKVYMLEQEEMSRNFADHCAKRRDYFEKMEQAVNGNLAATWLQAHQAAYGAGVPLC